MNNQEILFDTLTEVICCIMCADGKVKQIERLAVHTILEREKVPWSHEEIEIRINAFIERVKVNSLQRIIKDTCGKVSAFREIGKENVLQRCIDYMVCADGIIDKHEIETSRRFKAALAPIREDYKRHQRIVAANPDKWKDGTPIPPSASDQLSDTANGNIKTNTLNTTAKRGDLNHSTDSSDPFASRHAIEALLHDRSQKAITTLTSLLHHHIKWVRGCAAIVLAKKGTRSTTEPILNRLDRISEWDRRSVIKVLATRNDPRLLPVFRQATADKNSYVRSEALKALGTLKDLPSISVLVKSLGDEEHASKGCRVYDVAVTALAEIGDPALPSLLPLVNHSSQFIRRRAIKAIGKIGNRLAIPVLLKCLEDESTLVRGVAIQALRIFRDPKLIPVFIKFIVSGEHATEAAFSVGQIGPDAIPPLVEVLRETDGDAHFYTGWALGHIRDERVIPFLADDIQLNCRRCGGRGYTERFVNWQEGRFWKTHWFPRRDCRCENPRVLTRLLHRLTRPLRILRLAKRLKSNRSLYPYY